VSISIRVQPGDFDIAAETAALTGGDPQTGAVVAFTGFCRDENGRLAALELEHYPGMADAELKRLATGAAARWDLAGITIIHRFGLIRPGEQIVLVLTASSHRRPAFEAAEFLMDYLKTRAPFWKREHLADGSVGDWVESAALDEEAAERWKRP
jgi:molybdopterin synthase catalytic subunit